MKTINKRIALLIIVTSIFLITVFGLMFSMFYHAEEYALKSVNAHLYKNGVLVSAGSINDVNGKMLAYTKDGKRIYGEDSKSRRALLHIIGDNQGFISGGIQDTFSKELCGYNIFYGVNRNSGNTLNLTLDADLCSYAYDALDGYKGTIAVCNYKTGEIICLASAPSYDMYNKPENINDDPDFEGVYINRLFGGLYTPGSIFKVVTAMAAIENDPEIYSKTFYCDGSYSTKNGGKIICNDVHNTVTFKQALNQSCNCAFAQIAIELGPEKLAAAFDMAGLSTNRNTIDRIQTKAGIFSIDQSSSDSDIGWAGIGQHTTLVNPHSYLIFMCAIANGGTCIEPYFVKNAVSETGRTVYNADPVDSGINIKPTTASNLTELLRSTVSDYYGDYMFGGLSMCGKTGTAERDNGKSHAWFAGFSNDENFPFAVVAILEDSGSGLKYAGNAASSVMQKLYSKINN